MPAATSAPAPTNTPTPEPAAGVAELDIDIESDTVWQEVFDTLTASEQACIRGALGDELESSLRRLVVSDDDTAEWEVSIFSCLVPETARAIFLSTFIAITVEEELALGEGELSCLRGLLSDVDVAVLLADSLKDADTSDNVDELLAGFLRCVPDMIIAGMVEEMGIGLEDLSEDQRTCLRGLLTNADWDALVTGDEDSAAFLDFGVGMLSCVPALVLGEDVDLSEDEASCLRESLADIDADLTELAMVLLNCGVDDHADSIEGATAATVGEAIQGTLDYDDDFDVFVFEAEEGVLYQIDVGLGTLTDSVLELYDSDEFELAYNDDHEDSLASRIVWEAPSSGEYYAVVDGYGVGSYTLTVTVTDSGITDDHANSVEGATSVAVGEVVQGALDYDEDVDVFVIEAEEGVFYQIDVGLGTLPDSWLSVYDSDEFEVAHNDDHEDSLASRIVWEAPSSGEYYAVVGGYGVGSYTLTVAVSDIADDHANSVEGATSVAVGEPVQGALDYDEDFDVFAFEAEEGVLYQIDVGLGTLPDSWLSVYDSDEFEVAHNDDHADSPASRIVWEAWNSGEYYAVVGGYGVGSYTLTVAVSDIADDHANSVEDATSVAVGEVVEGALDYDEDIDVFAFEAEEGVLYQIDVRLGTLSDSWLSVYDSDEEWEVAYNDDHEDSLASRIVWEAPISGEYYAVVGGYEVGSYTLTVTR